MTNILRFPTEPANEVEPTSQLYREPTPDERRQIAHRLERMHGHMLTLRLQLKSKQSEMEAMKLQVQQLISSLVVTE